MIGFFLGWIETVLAVSLWPIKGNEGLMKILLFSLVGIAVIIAGILGFVLIHIARNYPQWLFNPGDYDPGVQDELFEHDYSVSKAEKLVEKAVAVTKEESNGSDCND